MKIVAFDEIYNFVVQSFLKRGKKNVKKNRVVWTHPFVESLGRPSQP
jgi:hypothetical protein